MAKINISGNDESEENIKHDLNDAPELNKQEDQVNMAELDDTTDAKEQTEEEIADEEVDDVLDDLYGTEVDNTTEISSDEELNIVNEAEKNPELTLDDAIKESEGFENKNLDTDKEIDNAIDDIVRSEGDDVLELDDQNLEQQVVLTSHTSKLGRVKSLFALWWDNIILRNLTLALLLIALISVVVIPFTRYSILNFFGVRVGSSMTIIDSQTRLPLRNINVVLQDKTAVSDENGKIQLSDLKLGASDLTIYKRGYADTKKQITLGWGSNPIGEQEILATGVQYSFVLTDWITKEPVQSADASAGENSSISDENGKIVLTVGDNDAINMQVTISATGYRDFVINTDEISQEQLDVVMVSDRKHVFVSNRNGEFDIYGIYLDGQQEQRLVEATGDERVVPTILQNPTTSITAFVSSREGFKNGDGFLLDGLYILDASIGTYEKIGRSEQIQLVGWSGDRLVYWQVVEGTSANNPERSKLYSYEVTTKERTELATSNYFNDIEIVGNTVYYAVSGFAVPVSQAKFFAIDTDGQNKYTVLDAQVYTIFRTDGASLLLNAADQKWYEVKVGQTPVEVANAASPPNLAFVNSPDGSKAAWVDVRDGKGVLLSASTDDYVESVILSGAGINSVLYWVGENAVVYRVIKTGETADYLIKLGDTEPTKITDITVSSNNFF